MPIIVSGIDALFSVSATDLVSLKNAFPRRWSSLAQPDLSNAAVINDAIEEGRFWMNLGVDGFRIDTPLAALPDRIKENWGLEVKNDLIVSFVKQMREIKDDCFIIFEAFERQEELLEAADNENCAAYTWQCRNYATDALLNGYKIPALAAYFRDLEHMPPALRNSLVYLGPEHDAFDFDDPWSTLSYQDRNIMYFIYTLLPGYRLIFDGEIYGSHHRYSNDETRSERPPSVEEADPARKEVRKQLFSLPKQFEELLIGEYHYLETDAPWRAMGIARFNDKEIVIGAFNVTTNSGSAILDLKRIINKQVDPEHRNSTQYSKETLQLREDGAGWTKLEPQNFTAAELFDKGFYVDVGRKGCEITRLVKIKVPAQVKTPPAQGPPLSVELVPDKTSHAPGPAEKGSPAGCLEAVRDNDELMKNALDRRVGITVNDVAALRPYPVGTVRAEFKVLKDLVIFIPVKGAQDRYIFSDMMRGPNIEQPELDYTKTLINAINGIVYMIGKIGDKRPLHRGGISGEKLPVVKELVRMAIMSETEKEFAVEQIAKEERQALWHIIEEDAIPAAQYSTIAPDINKKFGIESDVHEHIIILNKNNTLSGVISEIRGKDSRAIIDVALSDESHIGLIDDIKVKKMVFKTENDFIDLDGVLKALRALHYENADETLAVLLRLYSVMAGQPPEGNLPVVSGTYVFKLPRIHRENINDIPKLNAHLLELLASA